MAKKFKYELQPSLLDRLTDDKPEEKTETLKDRILTIDQLKTTVKRDLEWLLSTLHYEAGHDLSRYSHVQSSVLNYGVPPLSGINVSGINSTALAKLIELAIQRFESRIADFRVEINVPDDNAIDRFDALQIEIIGEVKVTPAPIHVYVASKFDPITETIAVNEVR